MIERYSRPEMQAVWSDRSRYRIWLEVELAVCEAIAREGLIPRKDWLELVPGLDASIRSIPAKNAIVDGELYGTVLEGEGARPASVYELYAVLQGERRAVNIRFGAFDLVYLNGRDLTSLPLSERRKWLTTLLQPMSGPPSNRPGKPTRCTAPPRS